MSGDKTCPKCQQVKPAGHFNKHKRQCKECRAAVQRAYVGRNRDKVYARSRAWQQESRASARRHLAENYGEHMTPERYDSMLASQGGACAICRGDVSRRDGARGGVDHCHVTGQIRGVLCARCNAGIAQFRDDPDLLMSAVAYLGRFQYA